MIYYSDKDPYMSKPCSRCGKDASIYTGRVAVRTGLIYKFYHSHPCWEEIQNGK